MAIELDPNLQRGRKLTCALEQQDVARNWRRSRTVTLYLVMVATGGAAIAALLGHLDADAANRTQVRVAEAQVAELQAEVETFRSNVAAANQWGAMRGETLYLRGPMVVTFRKESK